MRWTVEAAIYRLLGHTPGGDWIHYQAQRNIARSFPLDDIRYERECRYAAAHLGVLETEDFSAVRALEFGAGRHLTVAMSMLTHGVATVDAVDVSRLVRPELIRDTASRIGSERLAKVQGAADPFEALRDAGVRYAVMPPSSFEGLAADSLDLIFSTSVLEHVPVDELGGLLAECRRVLHPQGRLSCIVDYKDHYSYSDPSLPRLHFLSVPKSKWFRRYSPARHFQSRVRHDDLVAQFESAGFTVSVPYLLTPTDDDLDWLRGAPLDTEFLHQDRERLGIHEAHIVATKAQP